MLKRIGLLVPALLVARLVTSLMLRISFGSVHLPTGVGMPLSIVLGSVPWVVAAWLVGRWEGLRGGPLVITTVVAYALSIVASGYVLTPVANALFRTTIAPAGYGATVLAGLLGSVLAIAIYWLVALASKRWFGPQANPTI